MTATVACRGRRILFIEAFDGGSHAQFARTLLRGVEADWQMLALPARHWKWRMRGSAMRIAEMLEDGAQFDLVVATAMFPLAELAGLCPGLARTPKVLYFHENQFAYPMRTEFANVDRDHHFQFTQIAAAAAATECWFNSEFNRDTFLAGAEQLIARMPDQRPQQTLARLRTRARVLPIPLQLDDTPLRIEPVRDRERGPTILWNHRWEHDKAPGRFFAALRALAADVPFRLVVCGQSYGQQPAVFATARAEFADRIDHFGYCANSTEYRSVLASADIAVSTADQEFFGIATLEAVHAGARPLVPDRLAYRETIPAEYRYGDDSELTATLRRLCRDYSTLDDPGRAAAAGRADRRAITAPFASQHLLPCYAAGLANLMEPRRRSSPFPAEW